MKTMPILVMLAGLTALATALPVDGAEPDAVMRNGEAPASKPLQAGARKKKILRVKAGPDRAFTFGTASHTLRLHGWVSGAAWPPLSLWTATGPGTVTFGDAWSPQTPATFDTAGEYTLRLTADGGLGLHADELAVTVEPAEPVNPVFSLSLQWIRMADPAGILDEENGITDAEAAEWSPDGQLIITPSKADGRIHRYVNEHLNEGTSHLRLWTADGHMLWDRKRSRGPDENGDGRPDDQPADREDEMEIAAFSRDGQYVAAGGEDDKIEIWRIRDPASGELYAEPVLVRTFHTGAAVDGMRYAHSGDLLLAGTEEAGKVEVWRVQGDPADWQLMHKVDHGGNPGFAVNSLDLTEDDRWLGTAGTNSKGGFWRLDVTRDGDGLITAVDSVRYATLPSRFGKQVSGSGREARFENNGSRHLAISFEDEQAVHIYDVQELIAYGEGGGDPAAGPEPIQVLQAGDDIADGNQVEPVDYSNDGRFLVHDGDTVEGVFPGFFRVYETAEIQPGRQAPDPIYVEVAISTEYLNFSPDDRRLASGHGDGTVRLWDVHVGGAETICSEGFNESADSHDRWMLQGPGSVTAGENEWGDSDLVLQDYGGFLGHRGARYLAADNLDPDGDGEGDVHIMTMNGACEIDGYSDRIIQFAAAAVPGVFDEGDFLVLEADLDGGDDFETVIARFRANAWGDLALEAGGSALHETFSDFYFELEPLLPPGHAGSLRFRVQARTNSSVKELGFDSLRVVGIPVD